MSAITALLGEEVIKSGDEKVKVSTFSGNERVVGLYFSAHWCPPCRHFTPELAKWYKTFRETEKGSKLELIFVSSDRDKGSFDEYFKEMPWLALPYEDRERKEKLSSKFKVQGIPTLVFLDGETGALITSEGRSKVTTDPKGENFPWHPIPLSELMKGPVQSKEGEVQLEKAIEGKITGIYFSAHWCPPCRGFTPVLIDVYKKLKENGKNFEVLFVSGDRSKEEFDEYYKTMPWLALTPDDKSRNENLNEHFQVEGIPSLIILDEKLNIINANARGPVSADKEGKEFPWEPKPMMELTMNSGGELNEKACLVIFTDGEDPQVNQAKEAMDEISKTYFADRKKSLGTVNEMPDLFFMYEGLDSEDLPDSLRGFLKLSKDDRMVLIDIPSGKKFIHETRNPTKEEVQDTVSKFQQEKLEMKSLR